jgi:diaminopropionate ammonia-lyase
VSSAADVPHPHWYSHPAARSWRTTPARAALTSAFHSGLPGYAATPLAELPALAGELGVGRVFVKDESSRLGLPAFKALGASWAIAQILAARAGLSGPLTLDVLRSAAAADPVTLITATDGNHGRAVARIAALLGLPARVFVPREVPGGAVAAIAAEGAEVTEVPDSYDVAVKHAAAAAADHAKAVLVQDTAWAGYEQIPGWVVEGYATLLAETDAQLAEAGAGPLGLIAVPIGVGSLAQAVVTHHRSVATAGPAGSAGSAGSAGPAGSAGSAAPAVLGVEPETAACVLHSLLSGAFSSIATSATVMAGLNCGTPSQLAWPVLQAGLDAAVAVTDAAAEQAVTDLGAHGVSSGPSGASTLAGARAALTGAGADRRRAELGIGADSVVVLLSTEGRDSTRSPASGS